jgi:hypothetical protein
MNVILLAAAILATNQMPNDSKVTDLKDGYSRVETPSYSIEIPNGWKVSEETRWGQRKMSPKDNAGEMGVMTAPPGRQSWEQLYDTALFFIMREEKGKPTPFRLSKTKNGLEAASFEVLGSDGFPSRRYVMIKDESKGLLALSVKVPSKKADKVWTKHFERLIASATFKK